VKEGVSVQWRRTKEWKRARCQGDEVEGHPSFAALVRVVCRSDMAQRLAANDTGRIVATILANKARNGRGCLACFALETQHEVALN
jgi:hypothetical protein